MTTETQTDAVLIQAYARGGARMHEARAKAHACEPALTDSHPEVGLSSSSV